VRLVLVVNPAASSVVDRRRVAIEKELRADHDLEVAETAHRGEATPLAREAAAAGADVVVVFGGDGTYNEVANGLIGTRTALGVLPGGSTNVFARSIGMTNHPVKATGELLDALARGSIRRIGLGLVNDRYFLFHVGMGFDAAVVEQVERHSGLKHRIGQLVFVYAGLLTWLRHYDRKHPKLLVRAAGDAEETAAYLAICLNTRPYTYLGRRPLEVAAEAGLDRALSLVTLRSMSLGPFFSVLGSALGFGRPVRDQPVVTSWPEVTEATVTGRAPFPYQVDGDFLGQTRELAFRHEPDVLDVVMPSRSHP
jgi:diacylglycerol kinase family enzyme